MRVGPVELAEDEDSLIRQAPVTWSGGSGTLTMRAQRDVAEPTDDASGVLCISLPLAMRLGEDLEVVGPVSPALAARCEEIQHLHRAWDPTLQQVSITCTPNEGPSRAGRVRGCFFSRGVDSLFAAGWDRLGPRRFDGLVFADGLEPRHDDAIRREEIRLAGLAADALGLELTVVSTDERALADRFGADWEDVLGAGLSFVSHGVAGRFEELTIPSTDSYLSLDVCGSSPLLDPLYSTELVGVRHDSYRWSRLDKVEWLTAKAPQLLAHIKVCAFENRPDNCGRCGKCLLTMICLAIAGSLDAAAHFPAAIDPAAVAGLRLRSLKPRLDFAEVLMAMKGRSDLRDIRDAVTEALASAAFVRRFRQDPTRLWVSPRLMRDHRLNTILSLVLEGTPYRGPDGGKTRRGRVLTSGPGHVGPLALGAGAGPAGRRVLGELATMPVPAGVPVWLAESGELRTRGMGEGPSFSPSAVLQWVAGAVRGPAPSAIHRIRRPLGRLRAVVRAWHRREGYRRNVVAQLAPEPTGYLYGVGGEGRVPLYGAWHRAGLGLVVATTPTDPVLEWCGAPMLLGYLDEPAVSVVTSQ